MNAKQMSVLASARFMGPNHPTLFADSNSSAPTITFEQPFKFAVPGDTLAPLKRKLDGARLPGEVNAAEWANGRHAQISGDSPAGRRTGLAGELNALLLFTRSLTVDRSDVECRQACHLAIVHPRPYVRVVVFRFYATE